MQKAGAKAAGDKWTQVGITIISIISGPSISIGIISGPSISISISIISGPRSVEKKVSSKSVNLESTNVHFFICNSRSELSPSEHLLDVRSACPLDSPGNILQRTFSFTESFFFGVSL